MNVSISEIKGLQEQVQKTLKVFLSSVERTKALGALTISGSLAKGAFAKGSDIDLYGYAFEPGMSHRVNDIVEYILDENRPRSCSVNTRPYGYQLIFEYLDGNLYPFMIDMHLFSDPDMLSNHPRSREFLLNVNEECVILFGGEYYQQRVHPYLTQGLSHEDFAQIQQEILNEVRYSSIVFRKNYLKEDFATASHRLLVLYDNLPRLYCAQNKVRFKGLGSFLENIKLDSEAMHLIDEIRHFPISFDMSSVSHMYTLCRDNYLKYTNTDIGSLPENN